MKYLGQNSLASKLQFLLNIAWYGAIVVGGLITISLLLGIIFPNLLSFAEASFRLESQGLEIILEHSTLQATDLRLIFSMGMLAIAPALIVFIRVVHQLRKVFSSLIQGKPFLQDNAGRIKGIGATLIVWALVQPLVEGIVGVVLLQYIKNTPGVEITAQLGIDMTSIFLGLVILVLAEIFRLGAELQEEQDLTI